MKLVAAVLFLTSLAFGHSQSGMTIGSDSKTGRPNAFIAWRNSQRILEIEIEVKNTSERQMAAEVHLAILDDESRVLASSPRQNQRATIISLPPRDKGGLEGKIVQVRADQEMNTLIDQLDRSHRPYLLKASVMDGQNAASPLNTIVKTFNIPSRAKPSAQQFQEYTFVNRTESQVKLLWSLESSSTLPTGWIATTDFGKKPTRTIQAGQAVRGFIALNTPSTLAEGDHADLRVIARDYSTGEVMYEYEWFVVADTKAPAIDAVEQQVNPHSGLITLTATVNDGSSMIKEASGVRVEYSTDGGKTYSSRVLQYSDGNFVGPTRFRTDLGPFAPGTLVTFAVVAEDIAANAVVRKMEPVLVPRPQSLLQGLAAGAALTGLSLMATVLIVRRRGPKLQPMAQA